MMIMMVITNLESVQHGKQTSVTRQLCLWYTVVKVQWDANERRFSISYL